DATTEPGSAAKAVEAEPRRRSAAPRRTPAAPMIAYVDASVLLRVALRQPDALPEWRQIEQGVSSALVMTESLRTLDRLRLRATLPDAEIASRRAKILELIGSLELVEIDAVVLDRAAQPMPTELGTLDAIHLGARAHED